MRDQQARESSWQNTTEHRGKSGPGPGVRKPRSLCRCWGVGLCCSAWVEVVLGESIHRAHGCCPCWQGSAEFPGSIPEDGFVGQKHKRCARPEDCAVAVPPFQAGIRSGWGVHPCHHPGAQLWGTKPPCSAAQVGSRRPGGSCGHGQKVLKEMLEVAVWAGLRNPSTAPVPAQASPHNPHQEGICRAPSLSSF